MYILLNDAATGSIPLCRLCGIQCLEISYIDILGDAGQLMAFAIQKHLEIEISDKESYSKNVCHNCSSRIEEWNDYYNKCHQVQSLFKNEQLILEEPSTILPDESSSVVGNDNVSNHLSKLVEEFVQDSSMGGEKISHLTPGDAISVTVQPEEVLKENESDPVDGEDDHSVTEDEFEEELSSENESEENSEDSNQPRPKQKSRHKKFIFTIPFLEKKVERKFTPEERVKLQKHISKRQNTLICKLVYFDLNNFVN